MTTSAVFPWYNIISDDSITQGDIIVNTPIYQVDDISLIKKLQAEGILPSEPSHEIPPAVDEHSIPDAQTDARDNLGIDLCTCIIVSQACDIAQDHLDKLLLCPCLSLSQYNEMQKKIYPVAYPSLTSKKYIEKIRQGLIPGFHLLDKVNEDIHGIEKDFLIIDLKNVVSINTSLIKTLVNYQERRLRLMPPYREELAHSFARVYTRVGLPNPIPNFA